MPNSVAIAYIPVLHKGYIDFLNICIEKGVKKLYLVGDDILMAHEELDYINRKDRLRALPIAQIVKAIEAVSTLTVIELSISVIKELQTAATHLVTPNEDIGGFIAERYFENIETEYIDIFLRWNKENIGEDKKPEASVMTLSDFQNDVCAQMLTESAKSFDWWRQVGAALIKNGEVIYITHNEHMPEEQQPNINGDTRALFKKGININYVTAAHAEVVAIASAAKNGFVTDGAELFVTDFPCPYCARLIAKSGIKKVYFMKGYAVLEGDVFLKEAGVDVVKIDMPITKGAE